VQRCADGELFTRWWQDMLLRGVFVPPEPVRGLFLSLVRTADAVAGMLTAGQEAFAIVGRRRSCDWSRRP
jgi:glutamate-1-semialdehyde aminotransferase